MVALDPISSDVRGGFLIIEKRRYARQPLDEDAKRNASFVRQHGGSCGRCKRLKTTRRMADNLYRAYEKCKTRKQSYKILWMRCFQSDVADALFFQSRPLQDSPLN
jgi:hypothetical protein